MEVFNVFATMSLIDMMSTPLRRINNSTGELGQQISSLSSRLGALATSMLPIAVAGGILLASFGACVGTAAGFEDQMAKVGAISRASAEDMKLLEASARELGATTQFTAIQAAQGQQYLAMAGFSAAENIEALPAVLNMAAATATDLGRAADISSDILGAFGLQAQEMIRVADVLALTCATANTDMELLGDSMKYVAPIAKTAGMSIEETAAMVGLLGNVGIKGSQAGTSLSAMLNKLAAPTAEAQLLFSNLGISVQDASGNLRSPVAVLGELAGKMEGMGTATQIAAMKTIVGAEAISGFSELIEREGIGGITKYVKVLNEAEGSAEEMARRMNDTLLGSIRSMGSAFESVKISIGQIFIPIVRKAVDITTVILRTFDGFVQTPIGNFIIELLASISSFIVALTLFAGGWWLVAIAMTKTSGIFSTLKIAFLGLGTPILVLIGIVTALYLAYRTNFGGIADTIDAFFSKISMVFSGVMTLFKNISDGSSSITGDLAKNIKSAGLTDFIVGLFKVLNRLKAVFMGVFSGISNVVSAFFTLYSELLSYILIPIGILIDWIGFLITKAFGGFGSTDLGGWQTFGEIIGSLVGIFIAFATPVFVILGAMALYRKIVLGITAAQLAWNIVTLANPVVAIIMAIIIVIGLLIYYFDDIVAGAQWLWDGLCSIFTGIKDSIIYEFTIAKFAVINAWYDILDFFANIWNGLVGGVTSVQDSIVSVFSNIWTSITGFFSGINLYDSGVALLTTFKDGVMASFTAVKDTVTGALQSVRDLLPFSDAKEGPLSTLTLSGSRLLSTIGEGVVAASPSFVATMANAFSGILPNLDTIGNTVSGFFGGLFSDDPAGDAMGASGDNVAKNTPSTDKTSGGTTYHINIENVNLPNVENGNDFMSQLQAELTAYGV